MTEYVEKMALQAWNECHGTNQCENTINQVIADTKRAHLKAIEKFKVFKCISYKDYVAAINQAEVKGEGE